tara:strand:- start:1351 stop:3792 length:2442 start_codon:yes stop_codon:yes gene_type:complete
MYGYVKQSDGVLKPVLLKNIKNIFQIGNSVNIVYFQVGTTPLEIPVADQAQYYSNKTVNTCAGGQNQIYTLQDTDFVNGDVKITFGNTHLNVLETVTSWINSVLSDSNVGKVTLNEFAPSIKVGYVFSNEASMPTALAMPEEEGVDICDMELDVEKSKTVFVATDMVANAIPPVHTSIFEANFDDTTRNVSLKPLADGKYWLYQFMALTETEIPKEFFEGIVEEPPGLEPAEVMMEEGFPEEIVEEGTGPEEGFPEEAPLEPAEFCNPYYTNMLSPAMDDKAFIVRVKNGAIAEIVVCPVVIQKSFTTFTEGEAYAYTDKCEGKLADSGIWPIATSPLNEESCVVFSQTDKCLAVGDKYNFSEFWIRQEVGDESISDNSNYRVCYESVPDPFVDRNGTSFIIWPTSTPPNDYVVPKIATDKTSGWIVTPTIESQLSYPQRIYSEIVEGIHRPELGINGINMNVIEIPDIPSVMPEVPKWPGGLVMNGVPVTMDNPYFLADNGFETLLSDGTTTPSATATPVFWTFGSPSSVNWPPQSQSVPTPNTNVNLSYSPMVTPSGQVQNMRCLMGGGSVSGNNFQPTWQGAFSQSGPAAACDVDPETGASCDYRLAKYPPYSFLPPTDGGANRATYNYALAQSGFVPLKNVIPHTGMANGIIDELQHEIDIYWRDVVDRKPTEWRNYAPRRSMSSGLLPGMVNKNYSEPGLPPYLQPPVSSPTTLLTVPFVIPETNKILLDLGYTHRAFGVGTRWSAGNQGACGCPNNPGQSFYDGGIRCTKSGLITRGFTHNMQGNAPFESWNSNLVGQLINKQFDAS